MRGLCSRIVDAGMDAALLLHPRDVLYYAGTARPASLLLVPGSTLPGPDAVSDGWVALLFVRRGLEYARRETSIERVEPMRGFSTITAALEELGVWPGVLGIEFDVVPAALYRRLRKAFTDWELRDIASLVLDQRALKDEQEIAATRRAASVADAGHRALRESAAPGMSELELVAEVEKALRLAGHEAFQPLRHPGARGGGVLLMSGDNLAVRGGHGLVVTGAGLSPSSPYGASHRILRSGDLVVLDVGSVCEGYTADESRTYVLGEPSKPQQALFAAASMAEQAVLETLRPGTPVREIYAAAEAVIDRGAGPFFPPGSLSLPGFVGHGIGLVLDEPPVLWPRSGADLRAGLVLAIEIEVSAHEQADGGSRSGVEMAKVEDTVVIRSDGYEMLTHAPRGLVQCG